ncbi:MAG TPA: hypothetical protein VJA63_00500 [Candidatus Paceibacterota bacterium]
MSLPLLKVELPKAVSKPSSLTTVKVYSLIGLVTAVALVASYFFSIDRVSIGVFLTVVFLSLFIIEVILLDERRYLPGAIFANILGLSLFFFLAFSWFFVGALLALAVFLALAAYRGKREMKNMIKIHFFKASRIILGSAITALVIFFSLLLVLNNGFAVKRQSVDRFVEVAMTPVLRRYVPSFTPEMKTGDFFKSMAESEAAGQSDFAKLSPKTRTQLINQAAAESEKQFEEYLGAELDPEGTVSGNMYNVISFKLKGLTPEARLYLGLAFVGIIWLSIKSLEFIIYLPLALLAFIIYELLFVSNFIVIQLEPGSREVVAIK